MINVVTDETLTKLVELLFGKQKQSKEFCKSCAYFVNVYVGVNEQPVGVDDLVSKLDNLLTSKDCDSTGALYLMLLLNMSVPALKQLPAGCHAGYRLLDSGKAEFYYTLPTATEPTVTVESEPTADLAQRIIDIMPPATVKDYPGEPEKAALLFAKIYYQVGGKL